MPSSSWSDVMTLTYLPPSSSQLASSQLSHYFSDLQVGQSGGISNRGPIPLRSNGFVPMLPVLGKSSSAPILAQSILSGKSRNRSFERLESLDEVPQEIPTQEEESMEDPARLDGGWSYHSYGHHHRRSSLTKYPPILKHILEYSTITKKRVQFADDAGGDLTKIRVFCDEWDGRNWEPEPQPRSDWILGKSSSDVTEEDLVIEVTEWQVNFSQPAADYLGYREKLEANFVGLENVIVKQNPDSFMGTVKVKNVSFKKDVFVRCSFNKWQTFVDFPCKFSAKGSDSSDKYDTFSFEITIPAEAEEHDVVEFCIGFRTDGKEHWDSNSGRNYQLITSQSQHRKSMEKHKDAYTINSQEAWSQFASWNHLDTHQPYW